VSEVNGGIVMDVPIVSVLEHYEKLIEEGNDPVHDSKVMQEYMNRWGGSEFFRALGSCTNKRVLEVGVGTGRLAKTILDKGCKHFTGIDISPKTIERAKMNLSRFKNCNLLVEDIEQYQKPSYFDVAYSVLTFMHIENKEVALGNMIASICKGGHIVISISNENEWLDFGNRKIKLYSIGIHEYQRYFETMGCMVDPPIELLDTYDKGMSSKSHRAKVATLIKATKLID
jgi:2-polyprenyl-3-methyl-5-hydroxy-6-metoxy-1,4-benzoquinol methylase